MKFANKKIIDAADMAGDFESAPILLDQIYGISFQLVLTGTPDGTFKFQASNDATEPTTPDRIVNWTDIEDEEVVVTQAGSSLKNFNGIFYRWIKVVYTYSSGDGSADVLMMSKGV